MSAITALDIYREAMLVGTLLDEAPLRFVYDANWRDNASMSISPNMDVTEREHSGPAVEAYFENLLPEAGIRELLKLKYQVTTTFGLLRVIGGDTASDMTILPAGQHPGPSAYKPINWRDIADEFNQQPGVIRQVEEDAGLRISLAGAQRKLSICLDQDEQPLLPLGNSPSTYILKPDIKGIEGVWASAINETFVMTLGHKLGIGVAETSYQPVAKACVIKRYDRWVDSEGAVKRLHQLDLCQLAGKPSTVKYESDGGPSLLACRELLNTMGLVAADTKRFIQWIFFNLYVGNHDSHAKNLSVYFSAGREARLAPFYDLLSTSIYSGLSRKFAFRIGGENLPANISRDHIVAMSKDLGFKPAYVLKTGEEISQSLLALIDTVTSEMNDMAAVGTEETMVERLHQHITGTTRSLQQRLFGG